MLFEKVRKVVNRTALACPMSNEDDFIGSQQLFRNLLVKGLLFRDTFALVVRFLLVDQVVMKPKRVVGACRLLLFGP